MRQIAGIGRIMAERVYTYVKGWGKGPGGPLQAVSATGSPAAREISDVMNMPV